ncbi:MAG TPA: hypothetical protein ENF16_01610, partial [Bacteroidetes bacterium]|nr:hypothetical protein [Bacteroidota bacterium]
MKSRMLIPLIVLAFVLNARGQQYWVLLEEYDAPGNYAHGLYYAGKLLWHVDWDTSSNESTIYTMNPYNLEVIDIIPSPVEQPWGIGHDDRNFWLTTHGDWSGPVSTLVKIRTDTFAVDTTYEFPGYFFYGVTWDSTDGNLWIAAMSSSYVKYILEFNGDTGQVVEWHPGLWGGEFATGMQYWNGQIWANTTNFSYPDHTYIVDVDSWNIDDVYIYSYVDADGIATNGLVWWISYWRFGNHVIQKLIPPGVEVHDIAAHSPIFPMTGPIPLQTFEPQFRFINYGSVPESEVPFVCTMEEVLTGTLIYYNEVTYPYEIEPEEIVEITFAEVSSLLLQPETDYTLTYYSDLLWDEHRNNDTMHVYVHTEGVRDLALLSILEPDTIEGFDSFHPTIVVQNQGDCPEPVAPVDLHIEYPDGSLSNLSAQAFNLEVGEIDTVVFAIFDPTEPGEYLFTFDGVLPGDLYPENDLLSINCLIGQLHDVAPVLITCPETVVPLVAITPAVIVENLGDFFENAFYVYCVITDSVTSHYDEHVICPPLDVGDLFELDFPGFTPPYPAHYTFTFTTMLGIDNVPQNDTLSITPAVGIICDVAPILVIEPSNLLTSNPFQPSVVVSNIGTLPSDGFYTCCQVDSGSTFYYYMQTWVQSLNPGENDTVTFQ